MINSLGRHHYTPKEVDSLLEGIVILVDTREKENNHITKCFEDKGIKYRSKALDFGDYSLKLLKNEKLGVLRDVYFDKKIVIEKKNGIMELVGNLCEDGGSRLENEFIRSRGSKFYLMVEDTTYEQIVMGNYEIRPGMKSKYPAKSFIARIKTFEARYKINMAYHPARMSGHFIFQTLKYWFLNELKEKGLISEETMLMYELPEQPEENQ